MNDELLKQRIRYLIEGTRPRRHTTLAVAVIAALAVGLLTGFSLN